MKPHHHYTTEEKEWLKNQDKSLTYKEITDRFNEHFNNDRSVDSIKDLMCKRMNLPKVNRTQFKKGAKPKYEIGAEVIKQGYVWVKVNDEYFEGANTSHSDYKKNWKRKAEVVWEKANREIPKGHFLIFLDKNPLNCELDNLYAVDRGTHALMSKNKWYTESAELTKTAIELVKLIRKVNGK